MAEPLIEVVIGKRIVRVRTVEEADKLLGLVEEREKSRSNSDKEEPDDPASWDQESAEQLVLALKDASRRLVFALLKVGPATTEEIGTEMGKDTGKGLGPMRRFIAAAAENLGKETPIVHYRSGKFGLRREFLEALKKTGLER